MEQVKKVLTGFYKELVADKEATCWNWDNLGEVKVVLKDGTELSIKTKLEFLHVKISIYMDSLPILVETYHQGGQPIDPELAYILWDIRAEVMKIEEEAQDFNRKVKLDQIMNRYKL